jgi:hypothetical protein
MTRPVLVRACVVTALVAVAWVSPAFAQAPPGNFRDENAYRGANAARLTLVERFTRTAPDQVRWSVTVDDPSTWTRPWTFAMPLTQDDSEQLFEYACHEGNYAMVNILSGARAEEKAAAAAAKPGGSR